ncbi:MAG: hypothetical protein KAQ83_01900 [Nanoarchaeota archaeon]|nr:hypothetical protein [Nanoarchaeota archaeon]
MDYSLHTEYSFGKRKFNTELIKEFTTLSNSHKNFVPKLWFNSTWAEEFAKFIIKLVNKNKSPSIIEIHPPFNDYCTSIKEFVKIYEIFEEIILEKFPDVKILIEHRSGTVYKCGKFLISTCEDLLELHALVIEKKLKLKMVVDFPQIFTSYNISTGRFTKEVIKKIMNLIHPFKTSIRSIHLWGKRKYGNRLISHMGDLNSYFCSEELKNVFLEEMFKLLNEDTPLYFVPEVNSTDEDLKSIINDLEKTGFKFI